METEQQIPEWTDAEQAKAEQDCAVLAEQNDRFRTTWGADFTIGGQIVMTAAVAAAGTEWIAATMAAVQRFTDFNEDNDPYGDHAFASVLVTVGDETQNMFFKIDLYDLTYNYGSEHPTDLSQTRRVMTVMFPSDY